MLTRNKSLRRIDLRWNNIGMSGGKAIEDALRSNEALVEVLLAGNKVQESTSPSTMHRRHQSLDNKPETPTCNPKLKKPKP